MYSLLQPIQFFLSFLPKQWIYFVKEQHINTYIGIYNDAPHTEL